MAFLYPLHPYGEFPVGLQASPILPFWWDPCAQVEMELAKLRAAAVASTVQQGCRAELG